MTRFHLNVVAYLAVNTAVVAGKDDSLDGRRAAMLSAIRSCGLQVHKWFVEDVAQTREAEGGSFLKLLAACALSVSERVPMVVSGEIEEKTYRAVRAKLLEEEVELYDLEDLRAERSVLKANRQFMKQKGEVREHAARNGRQVAKANGKVFGSPNPEKGRRAGAIVKRNLAEIRHRERAHWFQMAKQDGAVNAPQIARWLNERSIRTAQSRKWTAANVQLRLHESSQATQPKIDDRLITGKAVTPSVNPVIEAIAAKLRKFEVARSREPSEAEREEKAAWEEFSRLLEEQEAALRPPDHFSPFELKLYQDLGAEEPVGSEP